MSKHPPLSDLRIAVALPSYDGRRHNMSGVLTLTQCGAKIAVIDRASSALTWNFNECLAISLNMRDQGITHMLMLHDDIIPLEPDWFQTFWREYRAVDAELMCAVSPVKNVKGLTSVAIDDPADKYRPRRLTLKECHAQAPTFTLPRLLLNTGCMLIDLRQPWAEKCYFTIDNALIRLPDGRFSARFEPEDWNYTRMARAAGAERIFATTAVSLDHVGQHKFPNHKVYGLETDDGLV